MEEKRNPLANSCVFANIKPIIMDLPYPEVRVEGKNLMYANLLSVDYCGSVSELSAITQYINNESRLSSTECSMAKTILGIAIAEMMHLQKLGELISLLGGNVNYVARYNGGQNKMWTPRYLTIPEKAREILQTDIESEKDAINQYKMHIKLINDNCIRAMLSRIIKDEEYHIMVLRTLMNETH